MAATVARRPDAVARTATATDVAAALAVCSETRMPVTLGHRPQSIAIFTLGGWLACRSAGQHSTRYGKIEDMIVGLEVALADGRVIRTGGAPRAATGPDLTRAAR